MLCLVVTDDLVFTQLIANALPDAWSIRPAKNQVSGEAAIDEKVDAIVVDLSLQIDAIRLVAVASKSELRVIGVAPHVQTEKIQTARTAGFRAVLTRSQVADHLKSALCAQSN